MQWFLHKEHYDKHTDLFYTGKFCWSCALLKKITAYVFLQFHDRSNWGLKISSISLSLKLYCMESLTWWQTKIYKFLRYAFFPLARKGFLARKGLLFYLEKHCADYFWTLTSSTNRFNFSWAYENKLQRNHFRNNFSKHTRVNPYAAEMKHNKASLR